MSARPLSGGMLIALQLERIDRPAGWSKFDWGKALYETAAEMDDSPDWSRASRFRERVAQMRLSIPRVTVHV